MAPPADGRPAGLTNLQKRLLSAAVLLPLVTAAIIFGHPYFTLLIALFAAAAAWEWVRVVANAKTAGTVAPIPSPQGPWQGSAGLSAAVVTYMVVCVGFGPEPRRLIPLSAFFLLWLAVAGLSKARRLIGWNLLGLLYVGVPAMVLVLARNYPEWGRATLLWAIALVVAADTGGYIAGRMIGGPKLAPRISPNKTWAGLAGAVCGAALVGLMTAFMLNHTNVWVLALISGALGVVEQLGDLVESAFKRHFGVKDTSHIIPGHGGVLDRIDGLLAVALIGGLASLIVSVWS